MTSRPTTTASPWWHPDRHADRRPRLLARNRIKAAVRSWFLDQGFVEVEPGCLQASPGNEAHLHAFATRLVDTDLNGHRLYLHTSPEFAMKKLLAAGETRIFAFSPTFRNREPRGGPHALHAPEFTMLEWYRAGEPYERLWRDCLEIARIAAGVTGRTRWSWRPDRYTGRHDCDVMARPLETTLDIAFHDHAGIALHETHGPGRGDLDRGRLVSLARAAGIQVRDDDSWADIFSKVLTERIEPYLGLRVPEILHAYPSSEAALARPVPDQPRSAERFELYCCGIELANGFGELIDAAALRRNLEAEMDLKWQRYGERYPIDEDFIAAVAAMPPASGCAMGFDRLAMLATGAERIDDVIWTPLAIPTS